MAGKVEEWRKSRLTKGEFSGINTLSETRFDDKRDNLRVNVGLNVLALCRKNYLFAGSHEAARDIAMFYSFFGTCKKNDIAPQKWLTYVIYNINDTKSAQLKELLPQFIDKYLLM